MPGGDAVHRGGCQGRGERARLHLQDRHLLRRQAEGGGRLHLSAHLGDRDGVPGVKKSNKSVCLDLLILKIKQMVWFAS